MEKSPMSRPIATVSDTAAVRKDHRFDEAALATWMTANVTGYEGPLEVLQFKGGQSNPTYKLLTPSKAYVLRRKPPGPTIKGAHALEREVRVLEALRSVDFPVARVYGGCADNSVIGTQFYVMEMMEGRIFWDASFPNLTVDERPRYFEAMCATMALLHEVDYSRVGLSDYGRPGRYCERQVERWTKQYLQDPAAGRDSNMDRLIAWLPEHIPKHEDLSLVHGDFRCDNLVFHATEPRIVAVLDWELSTLGDPLSDFAYHAMMYRMPPLIVAGLLGADLNGLNIPTEAQYVAAYCRRTGRRSIPDFQFYMAFNFFRIAAIFHGIKGRVIRGTASSPEATERAKFFPELARIAWQQADSYA
jgi:aminoglycoside phosphotransferase (APT) family kinase protein